MRGRGIFFQGALSFCFDWPPHPVLLPVFCIPALGCFRKPYRLTAAAVIIGLRELLPLVEPWAANTKIGRQVGGPYQYQRAIHAGAS